MKHLTTFRVIDAIVRTGSIRAAADLAALTPSAVQRRLQGYEDELDYEIFERGSKGVWTCRVFVPLQVLVYATFRSKATGLFQPNAEWRRRGL